jgi:5-methylcytosine-specific restriction endonuclease McrA
MARDDYSCQYPGCECKTTLQVHHIKRFAKYARLRTEVFNGVTLCKNHHDLVTGKEEKYEEMFFKVVASKKDYVGIKKKNKNAKRKKQKKFRASQGSKRNKKRNKRLRDS